MNIFKRIIFSICLLALTQSAMAALKTPIASGNWNNAATWSGGLPAAGDDIEITSTFTVTMNVAETCNSLTIDNGGEVIVSGALVLTSSTYVTNNGTLDFAANGTVKVGTSFTNNNVFTQATGTVNFDGTTNGTLTVTGGTTFYNLTINNTGVGTNTVTLGSAITVSNMLTLTAGVLDVSSSSYEVIMSGTGAAPAFTNNDATVGNFNAESGIVDFQGTANIINGSKVTSFYDLQSDVSTSLTSTTDAETITDNLTVNTGTLALGARTMTVTNAVTIASAATVTYSSGGITTTSAASGNFICNGVYGTSALATTGSLTVAGNTTIGSATGIILMNTGTFTSKGSLTVNGQLTYLGAGNLKIAGNYTFNGTYTAATSTVTFNGTTSNQVISGANISFYKLTISNTGGAGINTVSLAPGTSIFTVSNTFAITLNGGIFDVGTNDFYCQGTMTNANTTQGAASFNAESQTVYFNNNGAGVITGVQSFTFNNLTINVGTGNTVTESGSHAAPAEIVAGNLLITSGTLATANTTVQVKGNVTINDTYSATTGALDVAGNFVNNGTFTEGTGTVLMNGTTNQSIGGTSSTIFYNLTETNTGGVGSNTITLGNAITVAANLNVTSGQLNCYVYGIGASHTLATATFTLAANTTFLLGDPTNPASAVPAFPSTFKTYTFAASSTVIYQADAAQSFCTASAFVAAAITYGNVDIYTGADAANTTLSSSAFTPIIAGNLTIGDGASAGLETLGSAGMPITSTITIEGNLTVNNNGALMAGTGTINMAGTAAQNQLQAINGTAASLTFYNLTINNVGATINTVTLSYPITVNGALTLTKGILDVGAANNQITCNGNFANNTAALNALTPRSGTVLFTPSASVNISGNGQTSFYNLNISPSASFSVTVTGSHAAPMEIVGNELNIITGTFALGATTVDANDSTNIAAAAALTVAGGKLAVTNDINDSGAMTISTTGSITANKNIYIAAGTLVTITATGKIAEGTVSTNYINNNGTITYGGAGTLNAETFYNNASATYTGATSTANISAYLYDYSTTAPISFSTGTINVTDSTYIAPGASITFSGAGKLLGVALTGDIYNSGTLTFNAGGTLTAKNFYNNGSATYTGTSSTVTINANLYDYSTTPISFTTGIITVTDSTYIAPGAAITFSGAGRLLGNAATGDIYNSGTLTFSAGGILTAKNFYNNAGATYSGSTSAATIAGNLYNFSSVSGITFSTGTITLNTALGSDSVYNATGAVIAFTNTGKLAATGDISNSGTITYPVSGGGTLTAKNFYNNVGATYTGVSSTATISANLYDYSANPISFTTGIINVTDSTYIAPGATIAFSGAGRLQGNTSTGDIYNSGTLTFSAGGILTAKNFYNNSAATYTGTTSAATVGGNLYNYSTVASPNSIGFTSGTITAADSVYNASGASINFATPGTGRLTATTSDIDNAGTITYIGAGTLAATAGSIYNSGTITFNAAGALTTGKNFTNISGGTYIGTTSAATIGGNLYNYSATSGIAFTTGSITVKDSLYNAASDSITFSSTGRILATAAAGNGDVYNSGIIKFSTGSAGSITCSNLFVNGTGTATMNTSTVNATNVGSTGNVTIANGGTLAFTTGPLNLLGNFTDNGTFTYGTGTVTFKGTGVETISGSQPAAIPIAFYNVTINGTGNTVTLGDSVLINKAFVITAGSFDVSANDYHIMFKGNFTNNSSSTAFNARKGRAWFNGAITITSGTLAAGTSAAVFNDVRIEGGLLNVTHALTVLDTLDLVNNGVNGTFSNAINDDIAIGNALFNNSTATFTNGGAGVIRFENNTATNGYIGGAQPIVLKHLTLNLAHATDTISMTEPLTVNTTDTIAQGVLHCQIYTLTGSAAAGTNLTMLSTGTLVLGLKSSATNVAFPTYIAYNLNAASTVIYQAATATQKVLVTPTYGNLEIFIGGASAIAKTFSAAGTLNVAGNLTIGNAIATGVASLNWVTSTINLTGNLLINNDGNLTFTTGPLNIGGNFTNNLGLAGFTASATEIATFNSSTGNQVIGGTKTTTFSNATINNTFSSGTVSLADSTIVNGAFTITAGTFDVSPTNYSLVVNGGFLNNKSTAAFNAEKGMVYFKGNESIGGASSVVSNFYNVMSDPGAGNTVTMFAGLNETVLANFVANTGTFAIGANTLTVDTTVTLNNTTIANQMTISTGGLNVGGNFINNNIATAFTSTGVSTTTFNAAATTQTIGGTAQTTFSNVAISGYNVIIAQTENASGTFKINSGGTFDCGSISTLTMNVTGLFTNGGTFLGDNGTLALLNDLTNNSTFTAQTGTVSFNAAGAENINGSKTLAFYNATLNNSATVNISTLNESLTNVLTLNGTSALAGSDSLTMVSTPALTARIAPVASGANITLPFIMQRYVGGSKANYEGLASPSQASTLHDWAYDAGFYMSGVGGPDGNAGTFQSVYTINEPTDAYVAVTSTAFALTPGLGLYIYMATTLSSFTPFTFATHGVPTYSTVNYPVTHGNTGSNLVGNPYDCPLSWTSLHTSNSGLLGTQFSVFDRTLGNWESSDGTTASCVSCQLSAAPNIIPEHQGFLVSATSGGTMTFNESNKTTTDEIVYKPNYGNPSDLLRITLGDNMNEYQGNTAVKFDNTTKAIYVQGEDVLYMKSLTQEAPILYSLSSDGKFLNMNAQPLENSDEQEVMFYAGGNISGNYTLTFNGIDKLSKYNCVQLEDLRLGKIVQVEEGTSYTYQLNNTGTYKFILHFKKLAAGVACVLPNINNITNEDPNVAVDVYRSQTGATAKFTLSEAQEATISVYNTLGQKVEPDMVKSVMDEQIEIPLPSTNGMYIIRIETPSGVTTKRIFQ